MTFGVETKFDLIKPVRDFFEQVRPLLGDPPYGSKEFELESPIGEQNRKILVEMMVSLGNLGYQQFRLSQNLRQISDDAATHKALETMYVGPTTEPADPFDWARLHIENNHNSVAVRNRLRMVGGEFMTHVTDLLQEGKESIQILNIASGSSRGLMETAARLNGRGADRLRLQLVDCSREALADGEKLAAYLGLDGLVQSTRATHRSFGRYLTEGYYPDFVEIIGLMDYLPSAEIEILLGTLRSHLSDYGMVIYSNVAPNDEQDFIHQVVGWPSMHYRLPEELVELTHDAGFPKSSIKVIPEPLGIFNLIVAKV